MFNFGFRIGERGTLLRSVSVNLAELRRAPSKGGEGGFERFECENVKKLKMTEPFWGLGGLIIYGGAGLLEVAGVGGTAGGRVRNDPRADGLIRNPP